MSLLRGFFEDPRFKNGEMPWWLQYVFNVGLAGSQMISAIFGGDPDESISSRSGRARMAWRAGKATPTTLIFGLCLGWLLDLVFGADHGEAALELDEGSKEIWKWH